MESSVNRCLRQICNHRLQSAAQSCQADLSQLKWRRGEGKHPHSSAFISIAEKMSHLGAVQLKCVVLRRTTVYSGNPVISFHRLFGGESMAYLHTGDVSGHWQTDFHQFEKRTLSYFAK